MIRAWWLLASTFLAWPVWADVLEEWSERFHAWAITRSR